MVEVEAKSFLEIFGTGGNSMSCIRLKIILCLIQDNYFLHKNHIVRLVISH